MTSLSCRTCALSSARYGTFLKAILYQIDYSYRHVDPQVPPGGTPDGPARSDRRHPSKCTYRSCPIAIPLMAFLCSMVSMLSLKALLFLQMHVSVVIVQHLYGALNV